jgi:hypothetical protein
MAIAYSKCSRVLTSQNLGQGSWSFEYLNGSLTQNLNGSLTQILEHLSTGLLSTPRYSSTEKSSKVLNMANTYVLHMMAYFSYF